jgi:predicted ribonuclease YlaK
LRDHGSLAEGVKVAGRVGLRLEHREIDTSSVLSWLDPRVPDDKIIAAALRLQSDHPAGVVILVTADINLQNKADAVGLPFVEPPVRTVAAALTPTHQQAHPEGGVPGS